MVEFRTAVSDSFNDRNRKRINAGVITPDDTSLSVSTSLVAWAQRVTWKNESGTLITAPLQDHSVKYVVLALIIFLNSLNYIKLSEAVSDYIFSYSFSTNFDQTKNKKNFAGESIVGNQFQRGCVVCTVTESCRRLHNYRKFSICLVTNLPTVLTDCLEISTKSRFRSFWRK